MRRSDVVSASEIASWSWCPESWRLDSLGVLPTNQAAIRRGVAHHAESIVIETKSRSTISLGWWLVALGVVLALLAFLLARG